MDLQLRDKVVLITGGAKGIGEHTMIPPAPAILNALHDAIGIRVYKTPATPERVRAGILQRGNQGAQHG